MSDFVRWVHHPQTQLAQLHPSPPSGWDAFAALAFAAGGWLLGDLTLFALSPSLRASRPLRIGFGIISAIVLAGFLGMLALIFGLLRRDVLIVAILLVDTAAAFIWIRFVHPHQIPSAKPISDDLPDHLPMDGAPRVAPTSPVVATPVIATPPVIAAPPVVAAPLWLSIPIGSFAVVICCLLTAHALLSAVSEWDVLIYHAAMPKLWLPHAPSPPLVYGSSLGVEISGNYPPLFPGSATVFSLLSGHLNNTWTNILSPLLFVGILTTAFGYARVRFNESAAWWTVLLCCTTPLLLFYAVWPSNYLLLTALTLLTAITLDIASQSSERRLPWIVAGIIAGLCLLSNFYGALLLIAGVIVALLNVKSQRRRALRNAVFVGVCGLAVASPWLIRNLVLLHDPFYPIGTPPFSGLGLQSPMYDATKQEVQNNALVYWRNGWAPLRVRELFTALFDRHLLPVGMVVPIVVAGWLALRRKQRAFIVVVPIVLLLPLTPGWFWLRVLIMSLPIAAMLSGIGIAHLTKKHMLGWGLVALMVVTAVPVGLGVAIAGPNHRGWVTDLPASDDAMQSVRNFGSTHDELWSIYGGDSLAWEWVNQHVPQNQRVATFEIRYYYFDHPDQLWYLDGTEANPLLSINNAEEAQAFLQRAGVHYILMPAWATEPSALHHPGVDLLPLTHMLGSAQFPLVAAFAPDASSQLTNLYAVGADANQPTQVALFPGFDNASPTADGAATLQNSASNIFFAPVTSTKHTLSFDYFDDVTAPDADVNLMSAHTHATTLGYRLLPRPGSHTWKHVEITLPTDAAIQQLNITVQGTSLQVRNVEIS